uniref:Uncharacterized protein n=1 Tax=Magallana gigas TaxID=29159 RepID=K1QN89_MAGGI
MIGVTVPNVSTWQLPCEAVHKDVLAISQRVKNYETLVLALKDRFAPPSQAEIYRIQMLERRQIAGETCPSELGQAIQRLAYMAYPTATFEFRESLARDHFVDALENSEMRIRNGIKQSQPRSLNDAVILAVELEAHSFYLMISCT